MRRIPDPYVHRVVLAFEALTQNPVPVPEYDIKKLQGMKDTYRIRIEISSQNPSEFSRWSFGHEPTLTVFANCSLSLAAYAQSRSAAELSEKGKCLFVEKAVEGRNQSGAV